MQEVLTVYFDIILEFLLELYIFYCLVYFRLNRAEHFLLKAISGFVVIIAIAFPVSFLYVIIGNTLWGRILIYFVLFILTMLHIRFCFDESYKTVVSCCLLAYAMQNLVYKSFLTVWCLGERFIDFDVWTENFNLYYHLVYYAFYLVATSLTYFIFIRKTLKQMDGAKCDSSMLARSAVVLVVTLILCSAEDVYFAQLSSGRETQYPSTEIYILRQTGNIFSVLCCLIVIALIMAAIKEQNLKSEVEYLQHTIRQSIRQYEISKDTIDRINLKCHDIKYKLGSLFASGQAPDFEGIRDLNESISIYDARIETGNRLLNVLLTEKSLYCEQNDITLSCMADGSKLSFMDDGDLYCLFGNIVDNALEAVKLIEEKQRRVVNIVIKSKNDLLVVQEENYFNGNITFNDGLPITTKEDKNNHGFGMRSIRMITRKYDGELSTSVVENVFHLNIIIPINTQKTQTDKVK